MSEPALTMQFLVWEKLSLRLFETQTCIYSLRKVWDVEFLTFLWVIVFNIKYLKYYDPKQESNHITDLDANNLCPNFFQQVNSNG